MFESINTKILIIDDDENIRDSIKLILKAQKPKTNALEDALADLFDKQVPAQTQIQLEFDLDEASNGKIGYEKVRNSILHEKPYALILVDMRMPGWDGLQTVQRIRQIDTQAEILFVTAFSDYGTEQIIEKAGKNVGYLCKPFANEEILQAAIKGIYDWNKAKNLEKLIDIIATIRSKQWTKEELLQKILLQVCEIEQATSGMIVEFIEQKVKKCFGIGKLFQPKIAQSFLDRLHYNMKGFFELDDFAFFRFDNYAVIILISHPLNNEKTYFIRLFLEQAAQAIINMELQDNLLRSEKLSAIGQAISMLSHDLRGTIGSICQGIQAALETPNDSDFIKSIHENTLIVAQRCLSLVTDVLDFTRNSGLKKSEILIDGLIHNVLICVQDFLKEYNILLDIKLTKSFVLSVDETKLHRVFSNLIKNAAEALKQAHIEKPQIIFSATELENGYEFCIKDNGPGINEEILPRLFVPFATYGKKEGTGLGLAIVKQFVTAHEGTILVNTSSQGTSFVIFLPK